MTNLGASSSSIFEGLSWRMDGFFFLQRNVAYMPRALLILYLPVDLDPGPTLNLADGACQSLGVAEFVSIDEVS